MSLNVDLQTILKRLAPKTPASSRDRFVPYLEDACDRYAINTELRLAAFLATLCFESVYFRYVAEIRITKPKNAEQARIKRMQDKYWSTGYYGRGPIQLTHADAYRAFNEHLQANGNGSMDAARSMYPNLFIDVYKKPELVEMPFFGIEAACWYWQSRNLNRYADKGQFFAIQGIVNKGDASKRALDYDDRFKLYGIALEAIPDDLTPYDGAQVPPTENPAPLLQSPLDDSTPTGTAGPAPSFFDSVTGKVKYVQDKLVEMRVDPEKISPASWFMTITTKGGGWLLELWAYLTNNPLIAIAGVALIVVGVLYFSGAKNRVAANKLAANKLDTYWCQ